MFTQCMLSNENKRMISWIPKSFAKQGTCLKLRRGEEWENGWKVDEVWQTLREESIFEWRQQDWRSN